MKSLIIVFCFTLMMPFQIFSEATLSGLNDEKIENEKESYESFTPRNLNEKESSKTISGISIFPYYSLADNLNGGGTFQYEDKDDGSHLSGSFSAEYKTNAALGIGAEYFFMQKNSIGFSFGGTYELNRKISSGKGTIKANGVTYTQDFIYDTDKPIFKFITIYGNGNFLIADPEIYVSGGINFSIPNIDIKDPDVDMSISGKLGYQIALGYRIIPAISIEAQYRKIKISMRETERSGTETFILDYSNIDLDGLFITLKILFQL